LELGEGSTYGHFGCEDYGDDSPVKAVDPVCERTIDQKQAAAKTQYAGQTYYFCSKDCQKEFEARPAAFIGQRR
jgi:YHS domain-containing protein